MRLGFVRQLDQLLLLLDILVYLNVLASVTTSSCSVMQSKCSEAGGAIFGLDSNPISVLDSNFTAAKAIRGGMIKAEAATASIAYTSFTSSQASSEGGVMYLQGN